jgi:hypothetical protein
MDASAAEDTALLHLYQRLSGVTGQLLHLTHTRLPLKQVGSVGGYEIAHRVHSFCCSLSGGCSEVSSPRRMARHASKGKIS